MPDSKLKLFVKDESGAPIPFRAELWSDSKRLDAIWSDSGQGELSAPAGKATLLVRQGFEFDAVETDVDLAGAAVSLDVVLTRRFDARALGWYCGESHVHGMHSRSDPVAGIKDAGVRAAADGLAYVQVAQMWDPTGRWYSAEQLDRMAAGASRPGVHVTWNLESPKNYMSRDDGGKSGNLHCYGHGWTMGLKDNSQGEEFFFAKGPAFPIIQEVHRQGGLVGLCHPVRFWFNHGNFVSNWASEMPFDMIAGAGYDSIDILNDAPILFFQSEKAWHTLLNLGYKVAGSGNSDGSVGGPRGLGTFRTYTKIQGAFSMAKVMAGIRAGACVASSGPFVIFEVDGKGPGAEFPADGKGRKARIQAWSAPLPADRLVAVQLVRNGEVVRAWDLLKEDRRQWSTELEISDTRFAWYAVRVLSTCSERLSRQWGQYNYELAVANPVYFLRDGFRRPQPVQASVALEVTDAAGKPLAAEVSVVDAGTEINRFRCNVRGEAAFQAPATSSMVITADGHEPARKSVYMDSPLFEYCRGMNLLWPSFYSPQTWDELRAILGNIKITAVLKKRRAARTTVRQRR